MAYLAAFMAYPLIEGLRLSLTDTSLLRPRDGLYVGFENYAQALTSTDFWHAVWITGAYTFLSVTGGIALGIVLALAMNLNFKGRAIVRALITAPWATPTVAAVLVFAWMFNPQYGVVNYALSNLGVIDQYTSWLTSPNLAMVAVTTVTIWKVFPFTALVVLAALQLVPEDLYSAAEVDGADKLSIFRRITLPSIAPTLSVLTLFLTIWIARRFEIIWLLTGGGPVDETNTLVVDVYRESFTHSNLGFGSTLGVLGLLISSAVTVVFLLYTRRSEARLTR